MPRIVTNLTPRQAVDAAQKMLEIRDSSTTSQRTVLDRGKVDYRREDYRIPDQFDGPKGRRVSLTAAAASDGRATKVVVNHELVGTFALTPEFLDWTKQNNLDFVGVGLGSSDGMTNPDEVRMMFKTRPDGRSVAVEIDRKTGNPVSADIAVKLVGGGSNGEAIITLSGAPLNWMVAERRAVPTSIKWTTPPASADRPYAGVVTFGSASVTLNSANPGRAGFDAFGPVPPPVG
ncbi:MAG: hypothetical protein ACYC8T_15580 [Myxococcaceae bacterium]